MSASLQLEDNPTVHTMFHLDYQKWVVLSPVATFDVQFLTDKIESRNQTTTMSIFCIYKSQFFLPNQLAFRHSFLTMTLELNAFHSSFLSLAVVV